MIITTQTAYGFAQLLLSAFVAGVLLSILYIFLITIPSIALSCKAVSKGYKIFSEYVKCRRVNAFFATSTDFLICIIGAFVICTLIFIFYGGQFRSSSVAVLCLGFFLSKSLFSKPIGTLIIIISFFVIKTVSVITCPVVMLIRLLYVTAARIIGNSVARHRMSVMKKYTRKQIDKLEALTEFGLIELSYKELIK